MIPSTQDNITPSRQRVVVAMSGGVDSSVAACLLHQQGYDVIGVTMRLWSEDTVNAATGNHQGCCSIEDVEDARRVCQLLDIPHYFMDFQQEFSDHVMDYFVSEYERGRTPHPCIACNDKMKFDFLLQRAKFMDAAYVATGHYARIAQDKADGRYRLLAGVDGSKDQSYVLFNLGQETLANLLFPVGEYTKVEIRDIAREAGLPVANKPDSQEICFIPQGDYREFLRTRLTPQPGDIVNASGDVLGSHKGIEYYTVGQRRGLGLTGADPLFVIKLDAVERQVVVGTEAELLQSDVRVGGVRFVGGVAPEGPRPVTAKIRYNAPAVAASLEAYGNEAVLRLDTPQRAVTPGQAAVFYDGDEVLGGGFIQ
jgi:tRNA-specific 2-thiouridylase